MSPTDPPEARARQAIDAMLARAGWVVQDRKAMNLSAARGVAVREFALATGHGYADYLLFVDRRAVGVLEAKPEDHTLSGVEVQADRYARGLPKELTAAVRPLPFLYLSTGVVTRFTNLLDPDARAREVFAIHRPETLADSMKAETLDAWVRSTGAFTSADATKPASLRARLRAMPTVTPTGLRAVQFEAITNLEQSFSLGHPRALIQMATGSWKTIAAVAESYRLLKFAGARRVLFLVDRGNLGEQAPPSASSSVRWEPAGRHCRTLRRWGRRVSRWTRRPSGSCPERWRSTFAPARDCEPSRLVRTACSRSRTVGSP